MASKKPKPLTAHIVIRASRQARALLRKMAKADGCDRSTFVRDMIHAEAKRRGLVA
jgi:uncharacterized protein (DUF1778 family)